MSAPEDTTSHPGRPSQHPDVDIAALYARLQQEVVRTRAGGKQDLAGLRDLAERYWAVSAARPLVRRPGLTAMSPSTTAATTRPCTAGSWNDCGAAPAWSCSTTSSSTISSRA